MTRRQLGHGLVSKRTLEARLADVALSPELREATAARLRALSG